MNDVWLIRYLFWRLIYVIVFVINAIALCVKQASEIRWQQNSNLLYNREKHVYHILKAERNRIGNCNEL